MQRERSDSGTFENAAKRRAEHRVAGTTVALVVHEGMNDGDDREARACRGVGHRSLATLRVAAEDFVGEREAPHRVPARGDREARWRHLEDVSSTGLVEYISSSKETSERLTVVAVADEAEAGRWRDVARNAAHAAALAPKWHVREH